MIWRPCPAQSILMIKSGAQQNYSGTDELRSDRRFTVGLPVVVNTPLDDQAGWITDISRKGMKLHGINVPHRARIAIHYRGNFIEGTVRWSDADRGIGISLDRPLQDGPIAQIWQRFNQNVAAFGNGIRMARPTFGRKS